MGGQSRRHTPVVPATREAEVGGTLEPRCFETSLGNIVKPHFQERKKVKS